jgi:predicted O-methyltransferase YrrM
MQLASMFVRAANARTILDLGCGIGYSTCWLAQAAAPGLTLIAIDSDPGHLELAQSACSRLGLEDRISFVVGDVAEVLGPSTDPSTLSTTMPGSQLYLRILKPCLGCFDPVDS